MHLDDALGHQEGLHCMYNHHEQYACAMAAEGLPELIIRLPLSALPPGQEELTL